ncbi:MAG: caspase family protein [Nitrospinae bacterium]|nr:caspase family protein [Nitrospinota bacterium]
MHLASCILLLASLFSCSSTNEIRKPPSLKVAELTLTKGIDKGLIANPINPTAAFITQDTETVAHPKIENMHGSHTIRWDWHGTDGKVNYTSGDYQVHVSKDKFHKQFTAWHSLPIKGEKASNNAGEWQVKVYFDGELHTTKGFNIEYADIDIEKLPQTAQVYPNRWGLIIGIETYANLPSVDYAKKDALIVRDYFTKVLGIPQENLIYLADEKATKSAIAGNIKEHLPKNLEKDSTLYIYFAGHGAPDIDKGDAYLIPYDGDMKYITQSGYKLKDFYQDISSRKMREGSRTLYGCVTYR